jgi:hypothetical protein
VLGLFARGDEENFLWTHASLAASKTASAFFASTAWHNSGGDRTWLSPEIDVFFPNYPRLDRYWQPRELDPGRYRTDDRKGILTLKTLVRLRLSRTGEVARFALAKKYAPAPDPLRHERMPKAGPLRYAGYTQTVTLTSLKSDHRHHSHVSLWSLLQLPHGGDLIIPTYGRASVEVFMGSVSRSALTVRKGLTRWSMKARGEHKISVRAPGCTGRVGYLRRSSSRRWDLVVRNFQVNPSGHYPEVPWHRPSEVGHCVQACNVNSALGRFSELEYHAPAITTGTTMTAPLLHPYCHDSSQVWAYRGTPISIRQAAISLLGDSI